MRNAAGNELTNPQPITTGSADCNICRLAAPRWQQVNVLSEEL